MAHAKIALGLAPVLPVPDLTEAIDTWKTVLGVEPTFIDGDKWAQFDLEGRRLILSGTDRIAETPSIMVKTADVADARTRMSSAGLSFGDAYRHGGELRSNALGPGGWTIVLYGPASKSGAE